MKKQKSKMPIVGVIDFLGRYVGGAGFILALLMASQHLLAGEILKAKVMAAVSLLYLGPAIACWFGYPVKD